MSRQVIVIEQNAFSTSVKCPECRRRIKISHQENVSGINDKIGRLDAGFQNYQNIVCMNKNANDIYCDFAGNMNIKTKRWS